jgi:RimJ/RimL family protein N-acetyltransferase
MQLYPILQTDRLILRKFKLGDAPDIQSLAGDRAIADKTLSIPHPYKSGMAEKWIKTHQAQFDAGEQAIFAITLRSDQKLIGAIGLVVNQQFERAELGYWIGRPFWGQGYCTEAGRAVMLYGFKTLHIHRIHASHFRRNPASGKVMQKLGMIKEGVLRQHAKKWGKHEDLVVYGIVKREWVD